MNPPAGSVVAALLLLLSLAPAAAQRAACKPVPAEGTRPRPPYPLLSIRYREQGTTELEAIIARNGRPSRVRITKSSGFPRLDQAAAAHVQRKFLWEPIHCAGMKAPVRMVWNVRARCTLSNSCQPQAKRLP